MSGAEGGEMRASGGRTLWAVPAAVVAVAVAWTVVDAAAEALGPAIRKAAMVQVEASPSGSVIAFDDAAEEVVSFLIARDSVSLEVPWTMTVDRLLRLYHLENNQSVKSALQDRFGRVDPNQILPDGTRLKFALTPSEGGVR